MIPLQNRDDVIDKILKIMRGEINIQTIGTDPDLDPLHQAWLSQGKPC